MSLGTSVLAVFTMALGPFILLTNNPIEQVSQILQRLFPFGRGLVHAYWAPNIWSFYCLADIGLAFIFRKLGLLARHSQQGPTWTSGLVQIIEPEVFLKVTPLMTALAVLASMIPALIFAWHRSNK